MLPLSDIVREKLLSLGAGLDSFFLVAVSGGADSTALLLAMLGEGLERQRLTVAHLDHGVRPGSLKDAQHVEELAGDLGLDFIMGRLEPVELEAVRHDHGSLEAAMRVLRYRFLHDAAKRSGSHWILTGHTADDQTETVLFRAARGMDWRSLGGIPARRGIVLRPLLEMARSDTLGFCRDKGVKPLTDPSNYDEAYTRNRIRHRILPGLESQLGPDVSGLLQRTGMAASRIAAAEERLLRRFMPGYCESSIMSVDRSRLLTLPVILQKRFITDYLYSKLCAFPSLQLVEDVLGFVRAGRNGRLSLPGGRILLLTYGQVTVVEEEAALEAALPVEGLELAVPGRLVLPALNTVVTASWSTLQKPGQYPSGATAMISGNCFSGSLWVRRRLPGDSFIPFGMRKKKKLKDLLVDRKVPWPERDRIPVVTNSRGDILWVAGIEIAREAALEGVKGEKAALLRIENLPGE